MPNSPFPNSFLPSLAIQRFLKEDNSQAFAQALALRLLVFVDEQNVPLEEEQDGYDEEAWHWLVSHSENGEIIATGRMVAYQEACQMKPVAKIGRVAVAKPYRGKQYGQVLMQSILDFAAQEGFDQAILDAQTPVLGFYEKLGFVAEGDEFMDAGIPHFRMRLLFS